jgi:hypothetical protein
VLVGLPARGAPVVRRGFRASPGLRTLLLRLATPVGRDASETELAMLREAGWLE